eukprot:TRINITY_DN970_c1_g2_i1.p1 TRINITY_DN970_c1_g2~~TRINITY_DN970_c1_g2_i1.p1  ORF type:complete len:623 (-),score=187.33 TRINITY_DN970_c1_g2_i1:166-2034(-)
MNCNAPSFDPRDAANQCKPKRVRKRRRKRGGHWVKVEPQKRVEEVLKAKLQNRPTRERLLTKQILHPSGIDRTLLESSAALLKNRLRDKLSRSLKSRRSKSDISHILQQSHCRPEVELQLDDFLAKRPAIDANLLKDSLLWYELPQSTSKEPLYSRACHTVTMWRGKILFVGGYGNSGVPNIAQFVNDHWEYPMISMADPNCLPRYAHTLSKFGDQLIVFGGYGDDKWLNDVCSIRESTDGSFICSRIPSSNNIAPAPRAGHTSSIVGRKLIIFGGNDGQALFGDLWSFDLDSHIWEEIKANGSGPEPRTGHTATVVSKNKILIVGGGEGWTKSAFSDMYLLNTVSSTWQPYLPGGIPFRPTANHSAVSLGRRILLFGGFNQRHMYDDGYVLNLQHEILSSPSAIGLVPGPRSGHSLVKVSRNLILLFGGANLDGEPKADPLFCEINFPNDSPSPPSRSGKSSPAVAAVANSIDPTQSHFVEGIVTDDDDDEGEEEGEQTTHAMIDDGFESSSIYDEEEEEEEEENHHHPSNNLVDSIKISNEPGGIQMAITQLQEEMRMRFAAFREQIDESEAFCMNSLNTLSLAVSYQQQQQQQQQQQNPPITRRRTTTTRMKPSENLKE